MYMNFHILNIIYIYIVHIIILYILHILLYYIYTYILHTYYIYSHIYIHITYISYHIYTHYNIYIIYILYVYIYILQYVLYICTQIKTRVYVQVRSSTVQIVYSSSLLSHVVQSHTNWDAEAQDVFPTFPNGGFWISGRDINRSNSRLSNVERGTLNRIIRVYVLWQLPFQIQSQGACWFYLSLDFTKLY